MKIFKYNTGWEVDENGEIQIEMKAIRKGGRWQGKNGQPCGEGLFHHYREYWKLLWGPSVIENRWLLLLLEKTIEKKIVMIFGPQDSNKTCFATLWSLSNYYLAPHKTLVVMSSIDRDGLRLRIWAECVKFHGIAKARHPWVPGYFIESETKLTTDARGTARDFRKGIIGVACYVNGKYVGPEKYAGIKQETVIQVGDEMQAMSNSIVNGIAGFLNRPGYKFIGLANPNEQLGPEGRLGEPADRFGGWAGQAEPEKTTCWDTRFENGICINLVGTDSPNFDPGTKNAFPFLINQKTLDEVATFWGKESKAWYQKCKGVMKAGLEGRRVISRALCVKYGALEEPVWGTGKITKLFSVDAAFGSVGGDRCIGNEMAFGDNIQGRSILAYTNGPIVIPVSAANKKLLPEEQIAAWVMEYCGNHDIPPENVFFDSTGRGTLMAAFAILWSPRVQGIEFGGKATDRPVMEDLFVNKPGQKRRIKCSEHYANFVTELWYSWRYTIENGQFRGLPEDVMTEGCLREWKYGNAERIILERKEITKERIGRSPDMADACVAGVEGARRLGFKISRFGSESSLKADLKWLNSLLEKQRAEKERGRLVYA